MDETSFCVNPKLGKVLAKRGARNVYTMSLDNEKDCYTVLLGGNMLSIIFDNFLCKVSVEKRVRIINFIIKIGNE